VPPARLGFELGVGNDAVTVDASVPATLPIVAEGGSGTDAIRGGAGDDRFGMGVSAGEDGPGDILVGGGGRDVVAYDLRALPVSVTADGAAADDGSSAALEETTSRPTSRWCWAARGATP
jgi:hypothetical protein